jgi:hypothetical protein
MVGRRYAEYIRAGAKAGVAYAVTVFAIGFLLGAARVLLLAPRAGPTIAVLIEMPVILTASWYASRIWMKQLAVGVETSTRAVVGTVAFVTLMTLEFAVSVGMLHTSPEEYLEELRSPAGAIGFVGQVCFATFPFLNAFVGGAFRQREQRSATAGVDPWNSYGDLPRDGGIDVCDSVRRRLWSAWPLALDSYGVVGRRSGNLPWQWIEMSAHRAGGALRSENRSRL